MEILKKLAKDTILEKCGRILSSIIPYKYRVLNKEFFNFLNLLLENERKLYDEIKEYQFMKMKKLINEAYNYSDFYKEKFDQYFFHPSLLKNYDDIKKIPTLTREEVRKYGENIVLSNYKKQLHKSFTSGTTGKSLRIYRDKRTFFREWASICYQWERVGFKPGDGRVQFRGFIDSNDLYINIPDEKVLRINIIKMSKQNIEKIVNKIRNKNYRFFHGYPSAIYKFSRLIQEANIEIKPDAIMMASEVLYDWQMQVIDETFSFAKKISHYGQAEKVALGAWTNKRKYSFIPSYGLLEYDKKTNEMIGTGFINEIMPLIRYRLTDSVESFSEKPVDSNLMLFPVIDKIVGRQEDYTYDIEGNLITPAVVTFPFKHLKHISACKIIQESLTDFELIIESDKTSNSIKEAEQIVNDLKKIYGDRANIFYKFTDKIPVGRTGKFKWIECKFGQNRKNESEKSKTYEF